MQRDHSLRPHPRSLGWIGTTALAMGGSNQSLFLIAALFVGQGAIPGQGSAAVVLLIVGVILSWAAAPAWIELIFYGPTAWAASRRRVQRHSDRTVRFSQVWPVHAIGGVGFQPVA